MKFSLQRSMVTVFVLTGTLLLGVLSFGIVQYRQAERYEALVEQSDLLLFRFATLREQVTRALIGRDWQGLASSQAAVEKCRSQVGRMQDNSPIPVEYLLQLSEKLDLSGLSLLIHDVAAGRGGDNVAELQDRIRQTSNHIIEFDRVIAGWMRNALLRLQKLVIGTLAIATCCVSLLFLFYYRSTVLPLLHLLGQLRQGANAENPLVCPASACTEVCTLSEEFNLHMEEGSGRQNLDEQLGLTINEFQNQLNGIINYAQLVLDSAESGAVGEEEKKLLRHIIENSEHISKEIQQDPA